MWPIAMEKMKNKNEFLPHMRGVTQGSFSSTSVGIRRLNIGEIMVEDKDHDPVLKPDYPDPVNCFREKHGCFGTNNLQVFWYVEMGQEDFGIHMNAKEFERIYARCDPRIVDLIFFDGLLHEYFHHIVDSWCVRADVNRDNLMKKYEKEVLKIRPIHMLEESMAEAFALGFTGIKFRAKSGVYSLYRPFSIGMAEIWKEGSFVVANQYLQGKYNVKNLIPDGGFNQHNLVEYATEEWAKEIPFNSNFAESKGFSRSLSSGVWDFRKIPLHIHNRNSEQNYHELREWFIDAYETRKKRNQKTEMIQLL